MLGAERRQPLADPLERRSVRIWEPRWTCRPRHESGLVPAGGDAARGVLRPQPELRACAAGLDVHVPAGPMPGVTRTATRWPVPPRGGGGHAGRLVDVVHDHEPAARADGRVELVVGLGVAVDQIRSGGTPARSAAASSPREDTSAPRPSPASSRSTRDAGLALQAKATRPPGGVAPPRSR